MTVTAIPQTMTWIDGTLAAIAAAHYSSTVQWHLSVADNALAQGDDKTALAQIAMATTLVTENPQALGALADLAALIVSLY